MTTSAASETADILEGAADYIEIHGWCQKRASTRDGRRCAVGAITWAALRYYESDSRLGSSGPALWALAQHIGAGRLEHVPTWNDRKVRCVDEVIDALKGAAKELRNGDLVIPEEWLVPSVLFLGV